MKPERRVFRSTRYSMLLYLRFSTTRLLRRYTALLFSVGLCASAATAGAEERIEREGPRPVTAQEQAPSATLSCLQARRPRACIGLPEGLLPVLEQQSEAWANLAGGRRRAAAYTGLLQFGLRLDLDALFGVPGLTVSGLGLWLQGDNLSTLAVGDAGGVSNLAGKNAVRLFTLWVQQSLLGDAVVLRLGQLAVDNLFMVLDSAMLFINSGPGNMQTFALNATAPMYPLAALGAVLTLRPLPHLRLRVGAYDGDAGQASADHHGFRASLTRAGGALLIGEATGLSEPGGRPFRLTLGGYYHTGRVPDYLEPEGGSGAMGMQGFYAMIEHTLWRLAGSDLAGFAHAGTTYPSRNVTAQGYLDAGLTCSGGAYGRPADSFGVAITWTAFAEPYLRAQRAEGAAVSAHETVVELTYHAQLSPALMLQPTLQWIGSAHFSRRDALTGGLRMSVAL